MPDVIDLLSSTPPRPPSFQVPPPSTLRRASSTPASAPRTCPPPIPSDDIDSLFTFDDELDNPPKRRRLSGDGDLTSSAGRISKSQAQAPPLPPPPRSGLPASKNPLFVFSDEDFVLSSEGPVPPSPHPNRPVPPRNGVEESDPIVFTSSAPEPANARVISRTTAEIRRTDAITIDDDDDHGNGNGRHGDTGRFPLSLRQIVPRFTEDDIEGFSDDLVPPELDELLGLSGKTGTRTSASTEARTTRGPFSSRTASLLASLENNRSGSASGAGPSKGTTAATLGALGDSDDEALAMLDGEGAAPAGRNKRAPRKTSKTTGVDKEAKAREREAAKAQRERDKQLEKERKQKEKEEKAREKAREKQVQADLTEANKRKVDKKDSTPEMIVDLATSFQETTVGGHATEILGQLGVEHTFFDSAVPNVVRWRRKVKARFNETLGYWQPCAFHIRDEEHALVLLQAQEFVDMAIATDPSATDLMTHVQLLKSAFPNCKPIYLIEGLSLWMRKNKTSRNRAYVAEVRREMEQSNEPPPSTQPTSRRGRKPANKPETTPPVDDDTIEDALLELQVTHSCLIHHTSVAQESAEWIKNFTEHISTVPYRRERLEGNDSAFCMDGGQVKSGENKTDTYVKMLQEVNRVTASMAYGIAERYPSVMDLVQGMRSNGPGMLENVKKSTNKNGTLADARIGPAASKRLYKVFMGTNPASTDI